MRYEQELIFRIAKSVLSACENSNDLKKVIGLLKSDNKRSRLLEMLYPIVYNQKTLDFARKDVPVKSRQVAAKQSEVLTINAITKKLESKGFKSKDIYHILVKKLNTNIPIHKEGLSKYLRRISSRPIFHKLLFHLVSKGYVEPNETIGDPWLKEMIKQQRKNIDDY